MNGIQPGNVTIDDPLIRTPTTFRDILKPASIQQAVRSQLRQVRSAELPNNRPLSIRRLPVKTVKLAYEVGKPHGSDCTCILCKPPKAPKTRRFKHAYGG